MTSVSGHPFDSLDAHSFFFDGIDINCSYRHHINSSRGIAPHSGALQSQTDHFIALDKKKLWGPVSGVELLDIWRQVKLQEYFMTSVRYIRVFWRR